MQSADSVFKVKDLSIFYGDNQAVKEVNFEIDKKAITALIGSSGCGKSTFLRSINRTNDLIPTSSNQGEIIYEDVNLLVDNIAHALKFYGIKNKQKLDRIVEDSLKKVGLWEEVKYRLHESALALSGGQQQRLCIARTIAMEPKVLLLDEPSSALDPISNAKIEALIIELKKDYSI